MSRHSRPTLFRRAIVLGLMLSGRAAIAGGMALTMQNGADLGNAYSTGAAAEDASTTYYNPAGLALLPRAELLASAAYVSFDGGFENAGSTTAGVLPTTGGNGGTSGGNTLVPAIYAAAPISESMVFGLGINAPFGLSTDYDAGWAGRYHALKSRLTTLNINPSIGWRASSRLSLGAGLDWQKADAELTNAIDFGLLGYSMQIPGFAPESSDGFLRVKGDDTSVGFNVGLLAEPVAGTRIGLHFRSKMNHHLTGSAQFTNVPAPFAALFPDQGVQADLTLPEILSLSLAQRMGHGLTVFADWSRWNWSRFDTLFIDFAQPATPDSTQLQHWKDASIYSVGLRWRLPSGLTLRGGAAYNETPVPSAARRNARIPDSDRIWVAAGASWDLSDRLRGDAGIAHLFMKEASIASDDGLGHVLVGRYDMGVTIVSAQLTYGF